MSFGLKSKVNIIWQDPQSHMFAKYHTFVQAFVCNSRDLKLHTLSIVFSFSWGLKWPQERLITILMQNFGMTNKECLVCCGISVVVNWLNLS